MGKIVIEFETVFDIGNVVVFKKNNRLMVGIIEGYYEEDSCIWYNIRVSSSEVYTFSNGGDILESDIIGEVDEELEINCINLIKSMK